MGVIAWARGEDNNYCTNQLNDDNNREGYEMTDIFTVIKHLECDVIYTNMVGQNLPTALVKILSCCCGEVLLFVGVVGNKVY